MLQKMYTIKVILALLLLLKDNPTMEATNYKFMNIDCKSYDETLIVIKYCEIKAVSRSDNYLRIYAHLKRPVTACMLSIQLFKRANGWRPFLYNITFDACKFLKNPRANPMGNFFFNIVSDFVNFNHSCPYNHDIIVNNLRLLEEKIRLPFPKGEYAVNLEFFSKKQPLVHIFGSCIGGKEV